VYPKLRASYVLAALVALVPFAYLVRMCVLRTVDVPLWDEWELLPRLEHWSSGTLSFQDFWGQHNEHRPFFPIIVLMAVARLTRWDTRWEIAVNLVAAVAIFAVYLVYLRSAWRARGGAPVWLVPALSLLAFSPVQWENFVWGWQLTMLMCGLAGLLSAYFIAQGTARAFGASIACAVCATFSFASGLVVWPAHAVGVWIAGGPRRVVRLAIWLGAAAIAYASYFHDFHRWQPPMLDNFTSLGALRTYVLYVLTQLGTPMAGYDMRHAEVAGAIGIAAFAALAIRLRSLRTEPVYLFPVLIGLQTIATSAVSGLGRAYMGIDQAMSSRYTTLTMPLWCGTLLLAVLWRKTAPAPQPGRRLAMRAALASILLVMYVEAFRSTRPGMFMVAGRSEILMYSRRGLITGKSDALLRPLFPVLETLRERRVRIRQLGLSVFRPAIQPTYPLPGPE
jgi:hypothetical protein